MRWLVIVVGILLATPALAAVSPDEVLDDPKLEAKARALGKELRCLVCQNQSIDDSDAPLARDLRRIVRERLKAGDSEAEIKGYLVDRYGDFVLLEPPMKASTYLLWFGPFAVLLAGGGVVAAYHLSNRRSEPVEDLSAEEKARLEALLDRDEADR